MDGRPVKLRAPSDAVEASSGVSDTHDLSSQNETSDPSDSTETVLVLSDHKTGELVRNEELAVTVQFLWYRAISTYPPPTEMSPMKYTGRRPIRTVGLPFVDAVHVDG